MTTLFYDSFSGSGAVNGRTPEVTFAGNWNAADFPVTMTGGFATSSDNTNTNSFGLASIGDGSTDYGLEEAFNVSFVFKTGPSVAPNSNGHRGIDLGFTVGGQEFHVELYALADEGWQLGFRGGMSASATPTLAANTEYEVTVTMADGAQSMTGFGETLDLEVEYPNAEGLQGINLYIGSTVGIKDLLFGTPAPIEAELTDTGSATDSMRVAVDSGLTDSGVATAAMLADRAFVFGDVAVATNQMTVQHTANSALTDRAAATSQLLHGQDGESSEAAVATENMSTSVSVELTDRAVATDAATSQVSTSQVVTDVAVATSPMGNDVGGDAIAEQAAAVDAVEPFVSASALIADTAAAVDAVTFASVLEEELTDHAAASDAAQTQLVASSVLTDYATAWADLAYDRLLQAWVMNSAGAMFRYSGLLFNSVAMLDGRVIALGPDGFYALDGADDDGAKIDAHMDTGKLLLGSEMVKALGDIHVGYSGGRMAVGITQYGRKTGTFTYKLDKQRADSPRGGRITPGKGLESKYYRFTFTNLDGSPLALAFATVDPKPSKNRSF